MKSEPEGVATRKGSHSPYLWWIVLILLLAAVLRLHGISHVSPPGLEHDEVANWLIDRAILDGQHAIYFTEAYGHEAGFHYLQTLSIALVGDNALALRLPASFAGLLLIAIQFALTRRLFGNSTALLSTAFLAVLFWPVFYSRLGLRAILLPLVSGFSLYFWWRAWRMKGGRQGTGEARKSPSKYKVSPTMMFALAGGFAGLTLYTYMAARAVPIFYVLFALYLALFHWSKFKRKWRGILLFGILMVVIAAPLFIFLQSNPDAEFRITEIDAPLRELLAGDLRPVLENSLKITGMFGISGDPLWRQNVAGRPVYGPLLALLFYAGLLVSLWRWRDARYAYLLLWLGTSAVPSLVTVDAPSSIRMINALLVVTVFPALFIHIIPKFSTKYRRLSTGAAYLLALLVISTHIWWTASAIFHTWPQNDEVQFVWQAALTDTAEYLDTAPNRSPVAVGGWSPDTLDPATMFLSMRSRDLDMRYIGSDSTAVPVTTIIVPSSESDQGARITRPAIRELAPGLEAQLVELGAQPQEMGSFVLYEIDQPAKIQPKHEMRANFEDELQFLGFGAPEFSADCSAEGCPLLAYWRVISATTEPRRFFLHAVDETGSIIAQFDGLDAPARYWQPGDLLVQEHLLDYEVDKLVELRLGVYNPLNGRRLLLPDGSDHVSFSHP